MADFRPFRAVRYAESAGRLDDLICPPYDVIGPEAERRLLARSPRNMVRLELAEPPSEISPSRYEGAATALREMLASGALVRDAEPAYYLLRQRFSIGGAERERRCLLGALRLEEFGAGVLPHEDTAPGPKADRLALMRACRANFSPLMMLYDDPSGAVGRTLDAAEAAPPDAEFAADGERFALWAILDASAASAIADALAGEPVYVADGHHRYETALTYRDEAGGNADFTLTGLIAFDDPGLAIQPYYRVVHSMTAAQAAKMNDLLSLYFVSRPSGTPPGDAGQLDAVVAALGQGQAALGVVERGKPPRVLTPANDVIPEPDPDAPPETQARSVEAFVLQEMLLRPVFGEAFAERVAYVHGGAEAMAMAEEREGRTAFFMKGVPPDVFRAIVGAGMRLPRKSTYFHPKLPSGAAINLLDGVPG